MRTIKIGRGSNNHVVVDDPNEQVSRLHAEVRLYRDGRITLVDRSSNGTWVNGLRLDKDKEYPISQRDRVVLAHIFQLDWNLVLDPRIATGGRNVATNFLRDAGSLVDEMADISGFRHGIQTLWSIVVGGAARIVHLAGDNQIPKREILGYFGVGLTAAVIVFSKAMYWWEEFQTTHGGGSDISELTVDIGVSIALALFTFMLAVVNYRVFKWLSTSGRRWQHYFRVYCYTAGTYFWLVTISLMPALSCRIILGKDNPFFGFLSYWSIALVLLCTLWAIGAWIIVNIRFWD